MQKDNDKKPNINKAEDNRNSPVKNRKKRVFTNLKVSVVIPLLNEEESLKELSAQLQIELNKIAGNSWEVLFIDDGSTDNSYEIIKEINKENKKFKALRFRRNYGKSAALAVGFNVAKGDIVFTMDADLQDDPKELINLQNKLKEGYDLVSGWKKVRHDPISKTLPSKFFNFVTSSISGIKLHDFNCGLKAYKKEVVKRLHVYGEMHRYLPALAFWEGFKVTELAVTHHPRKYGKSKFGLKRFINGFLDLLTVVFTTRYLRRPLHFFGPSGFIIAMAGFIINVYLTIEWALGKTYLSNRPLALLGVGLIIVGIQFISTGLLGEMLVKNMQQNTRNNYSIKEKL